MLLIALDTATPACSVALVDVDRVHTAGTADAGRRAVQVTSRASRQVVDPRRHAELLVPLVREVLDEAAVRPADLDAVVVGLGPGPFTSLRVGVVTAGAFADALGKPAYGICSLDAVGADVPGRVAVATDARRREVYWAVYADGVRIAGPFVGRPQTVVDVLREMSVDRVVGPGVALYPDVFADLTGIDPGSGPGARPGSGVSAQVGSDPDGAPGSIRPVAPGYPSPIILARLAAPDVLARRPSAPLVPLYLRRPDAAEPHPPKAVAV